MDIPSLYEQMESARKPYLDNAHLVSLVTIPDLDVLGNNCYKVQYGDSGKDRWAWQRPYTSTCTYAVTRLSNTIHNLLVPSSVNWFKLGLPIQTKMALQMAEAAGQYQQGTTAAIEQAAAQGETMVLEKMAEHGLYSRSSQPFIRFLIEGQFVAHVTNGYVRFLPLRSFVVKRKYGSVETLILKEELEEDVYLYTHVDYKRGTVKQQRSDQKTAKQVNWKPSHFVVVAGPVEDDRDYAVSYALRHYPTMWSINYLSAKIQELTNWSALNIMVLDNTINGGGNNMTIQEFQEKLARGDNVFSGIATPDGRMGGIGFFSAASKSTDIAILSQELARQEQMLTLAFSLGLTAQASQIQGRERVTSYEIEVRRQEVDSSMQAFASVLESTFQRPIVEAYVDILGIALPTDNGQPTVRPVIVAGANLLNRTIQTNGLYQVMAQINNIPETAFSQRIDRFRLFVDMAKSMGLQDPEKYILPPPQQDNGQQPPAV
jgi:type 1 glutamine amidotransferase